MRVKTKLNQKQRKSLRMPKKILPFLAVVLLLASCDRSTLMHSYQPLKNKCWDRTDTVKFVLPPLPQDENCNMLIGLRLNNNFPYEQLVLQVEQNLQHPTVHKIDTIYYRTTDQDGNFTEKGVHFFQYETQGFPLHLKKGQTGEIRIRHLMHREVLPGIVDVGIHIIH